MSLYFIDELRWRGQLHQFTPEVEKLLAAEKINGYCGFDPTATSLTIGNFVPIILLMRFQQAGHKPIALVGGATGLIGDPSGKSAERQLLTLDKLNENVEAVKKQLSKYLDFDKGTNAALLVNNYDWFKDMSVFSFLRDIGKHLTVNYMMAKDSVQSRMENGISFTEFSYQLIQGYDYYHLWKHYGCQLQLAGSDQWGNITTGIELIRRMEGGEAHALTCPLVTKADGTKFGKTESGALWLDRNLTTPYQFYQYWINTTDDDAKKYIKLFSFLDEKTIHEICIEHDKAPHLRLVQQALAKEITTLVHHQNDYDLALKTSEVLFGNATKDTLHTIAENQWQEIFAGVPQFEVARSVVEANTNVVSFLAEATAVFPSKGEAKKMIQAGGVMLNKEKISSLELMINNDSLIQNKYIVIQKGKKNYFLIHIK
jgi:tyrosyl-tRNA synthetase